MVGGGATVVATLGGVVDGATVDGAGAVVEIVEIGEIGESVATDVVELAPMVALEPSTVGSESEPHAVTPHVTATMAINRVTRMVILSGTHPPPDANHA